MGMDGSTWWVFLLKPWFGLVYIVLLLLSVHWIARVIYRIFPDGKVKDYLFLGWNGGGASRSAKPEQRILDDTTLLRRESPEDSSRL